MAATLAGEKPNIDRVGLAFMLKGEARQGRTQLLQKILLKPKSGSINQFID